MKGIILAGGSGTRLHPITLGISKQLLPVYNKPMIYYPISIMIMSNIREIMIITTREDQGNFKRLLGDGSQFGVNFSYTIQEQPNGIAEAFILCENYIGNDTVCLILGDNIFYGHGLYEKLRAARSVTEQEQRAVIFGYNVDDPFRYGIVELDNNGNALSIEEKPDKPKSNMAVVGLYYYPNNVVEIAKTIKPSARGELEITAVNEHYLNQQTLKVQVLKRGYIWFDVGTHDSLAECSMIIKGIENCQGFKIACLEEQALIQGFITYDQAIKQGHQLGKTLYGKYIIERANELRLSVK